MWVLSVTRRDCVLSSSYLHVLFTVLCWLSAACKIGHDNWNLLITGRQKVVVNHYTRGSHIFCVIFKVFLEIFLDFFSVIVSSVSQNLIWKILYLNHIGRRTSHPGMFRKVPLDWLKAPLLLCGNWKCPSVYAISEISIVDLYADQCGIGKIICRKHLRRPPF